MNKYLNWWSILIIGFISISYGLLALLTPNSILSLIGLYIGIVVLLFGIICIFVAVKNKKNQEPFKDLMAEGIVLSVIGLFLIIFSKQLIAFFVFLIGIWAVVIGIVMIFTLLYNRDILNFSFYLICGLISLIIGVVLIINPFTAAEIVTRVSGIISLALGVIVAIFSLNIRSTIKQVEEEIRS